MPYNDYFEYFGPDYRLHLPVSNMENLNSAKYLEGGAGSRVRNIQNNRCKAMYPNKGKEKGKEKDKEKDKEKGKVYS